MDSTIFALTDQYISALFGGEDEALLAADRSLELAGMPPISVSPNQGKFLYIMALLSRAQNILEIGTLAGYSTIWLARAVPASGKLISLELDPKHAAVATENIKRAGLENKVEIMNGRALDILPQLIEQGKGPFDFIFIDADKPPYAEYFEFALKLSKPGTLIIADNVIREGKVLNEKSTDEMVRGAQRFNRLLASCKSVDATILQTVGLKEHDGMALAVVK